MAEAQPRQVTLFYSWQSDRDEGCCKRFIRLAADTAAEAVGAKLGVRLIVDADTEGVAGTPPINETILRKIDESDLFLGDMTFVGETPKGKLIPNPNVMAEYGYALRAKGPHRILLAMNTLFGPPGDLPFDLKHQRWPAQYACAAEAPDGERRKARQRFAEALERNLTVAVQELLKAPSATSSDRWDQAQAALGELFNSQVLGVQPVIVTSPKLMVRAVPLASLDHPHLAAAAVKAARPLFPPSVHVRIDEGQDETQWWTFEPPRPFRDKPNPESNWSFRLARPGVFEVAANIGRRIDDDPDIGVDGAHAEALLVNAVNRISKVAAAVGLGGPTLLAASLEGLQDVAILRSRPGAGGRRIRKPHAMMGTLRIDTSEGAADQLLPMLEQVWLVGGWDDGSPFIADGRWAGEPLT